jgi:hypothetical protein
MDHRQKLENLNKESLKLFEEYLRSKEHKEHNEEHKDLVKASEDWQIAWNKFIEAVMVLERLEI